MISKERLKELIEQKATIWSSEYGKIKLIPESDILLYENGNDGYILYTLEPNKKYHNEIFDEDLFETKEDAEFVLKTRAERTEYFEPPTWEDFLKTKEYKFISYDGFRKKIYIEPTTGKLSSCTKFIGKPTKENYIKACEMARKLFLEEKTDGKE